jgi:hypothetical protein
LFVFIVIVISTSKMYGNFILLCLKRTSSFWLAQSCRNHKTSSDKGQNVSFTLIIFWKLSHMKTKPNDIYQIKRLT